jgi:hypothetical protein
LAASVCEKKKRLHLFRCSLFVFTSTIIGVEQDLDEFCVEVRLLSVGADGYRMNMADIVKVFLNVLKN